MKKVLGAFLVLLALSTLVGSTIYKHGLFVALLSWGTAIVFTAVIVCGIWLLTE